MISGLGYRGVPRGFLRKYSPMYASCDAKLPSVIRWLCLMSPRHPFLALIVPLLVARCA